VAWRFERGEAFDDAFRRVAGDEIARIRDSLTSGDIDRAQAIHQARRSFKRLRALLRLARPSLASFFSKADRRWRDAGRLLASSRDATVLLETFDRVVEDCGAGLPPGEAAALRQRIAATVAPDEEAEVARHVDQVVGTLHAAADEAGALPWPASKAELCRGLKDSQAHLKRSWKAARNDPKPQKLHEWRKRVKDYTAQISLVRMALPHDLKVCRSDSKEFAEILGEEHDLSMLRAKLKAVRDTADLRRVRDLLVKATDARRTKLCRAAFEKGKDLSSRRPKRFAEEIAARLVSSDGQEHRRIPAVGRPAAP
jgi:CHAD domain-containing protein